MAKNSLTSALNLTPQTGRFFCKEHRRKKKPSFLRRLCGRYMQRRVHHARNV
jgi:hypothetical protein